MLNEEHILFSTTFANAPSSKIRDKSAAGIRTRKRVNVAQRSIDEILHPYVSRIWNRGKAALAALTNDISTTTTASLGFILLDIGAILSRAKTVYSANIVFTNVRATKYVTRTYISLDTRVSWASTIRRLTHLLILRGYVYETLFHLSPMWDKFDTKTIITR